jgi:hypothetical protein
VRRTEIIGARLAKRFRKTGGLKSLVFTLILEKSAEFLQNQTNQLGCLHRLGLQHLQDSLKSFLSPPELATCHQLQAFSSALLESTDIIRACPNFHGHLMFSNILVIGEGQIAWYAKICKC